MSGVSGFLNVYKDSGYTSHDVVAIVKGMMVRAGLAASRRKVKVGHTGTLDPAAKGVLVVCVGKATKLADYAGVGSKTYRAVLKLGQTSDTQDDTGVILSRAEVSATREEISDAVRSFLGEIEQIPPMYSAIKQGGKRLYDIARNGEVVERKPRKVMISDIRVEQFLGENSLLVEVVCSRGTYIRTLCHDIGRKLGCGALMGELVRTQNGIFSAEDAKTLAELEHLAEYGGLDKRILPVWECLPYGSVVVSEAATPMMLAGAKIRLETLTSAEAEPTPGGRVFVRGFDGRMGGLFEYAAETGETVPVLKPLVMLAGADAP